MYAKLHIGHQNGCKYFMGISDYVKDGCTDYQESTDSTLDMNRRVGSNLDIHKW